MLKRTLLKRGTSSLKRSPLKRGEGLKRTTSSLKRGGVIKKCAKSDERLAEDQLKRNKRNAFWEICWQELPRESEISGKKFWDLNRTHYHHIFPKSKYPEIEFSLDVILCVTFEEHQIIEKDLEFYPLAAERRKYVLENWEDVKKNSTLWELEFERKLLNKNLNGNE